MTLVNNVLSVLTLDINQPVHLMRAKEAVSCREEIRYFHAVYSALVAEGLPEVGASTGRREGGRRRGGREREGEEDVAIVNRANR